MIIREILNSSDIQYNEQIKLDDGLTSYEKLNATVN